MQNENYCNECGVKISKTSTYCAKCANKGERCYWYGKKLSNETCEKISKKAKGRTSPLKGVPCSIETRRKIGKANKGKKPSEETNRKRSETAKRNGVGKWRQGMITSEETKIKISERMSLEKHWNWKGGLVTITCMLCGKTREEKPSRLKRGHGKFCSVRCNSLWNKAHNIPFKNTSIELAVEDKLKELGIKYEAQKVIPEGRTIADFYIPEQQLVIYADGWFWHESEWAEKKGIIKKDDLQNLALKNSGYKVLRLPEQEIKNGIFTQKLQEALGVT